MKQIKGGTSHLMNREHGPFRWQDGYAAFTVRKADVPALLQYIRNQREHHRAGRLGPDGELPGSAPASSPDLSQPVGNPEGV